MARSASSLLALAVVSTLVSVAACGDGDENPAEPGRDASSSGNASSGQNDGAPDDDAGGSSSSGQIPDVEVPECILAEGDAEGATELVDGELRASVTTEGSACARGFRVTTNAALRDGVPANPRQIAEKAERASVQTRSPLFDAMYQLALEEADECSVDAIRDWGFNDGAPVSCGAVGCFETGRKWNYVWTRDTAYAVDLGLGWVDAPRAAGSLNFKLSERRSGGGLEIVQDTGTGGSYPVSTDRVVWAIGAKRALAYLQGEERAAFAARTLEAIKNTVARDRKLIFDARDGLYRGEHSFLDWREQTYPRWGEAELSHIAMSKSLSTNVGHLVALETAAALATESGASSDAAELSAMADALRLAIRERFWLPEEHQFATYYSTELDRAPSRRFDLLATSLAILYGVATDEQAREALASYPTLSKGPPVIFPQQQDIPVYHNRAIWPFVTAYWVHAAQKAQHDTAYEAGVRSLLRGAALNLSNMENLEVASGTAWFEDGAFSGPVVNSQRQLWSVAGYIGMVNEGVFGLHAEADGLRIAPFVTTGMHRDLLGGARSVALNRVPFHGKSLSVELHFPEQTSQDGAYVVARARVNGVPVEGVLRPEQLAERNWIEVDLAAPTSPPAPLTRLDDLSNYRVLYGPKTPSVSVSVVDGKIALAIGNGGETAGDVKLTVYRDGERIAQDLPGSTSQFVDPSSSAASPSHCYTVESEFVASGTVSQRANPACYWGASNARIQTLAVGDFANVGGSKTTEHGHTFYQAWGDASHSLTGSFTAAHSGEFLVQALYGNGSGPKDTGITCAVKRVSIERVSDAEVVGTGVISMPQRGPSNWASWGDSSFVRASLEQGVQYRVRIYEDTDSVNMSVFEHFATYTGNGATGGRNGVYNRVNIAQIKLLWLGE